jgi:hypothetical protein
MRRIINNRAFDTETADCLGINTNNLPISDCNAFKEVLYRKKNGEFFLRCSGGALTKYATISGRYSSWGEKIQALDESEAKEWAESHLTGEEYEAIFGKVEE